MVNIFAILKPIVHLVMKLAGITPQMIEIEPGTVMKFWVPTEIINKSKTPNQKPNKTRKHSVVFLHGFFADGILTWLFQALALSSNYNVYVPDHLFFGGSITDTPDRSINFQAECLAKGLRKLGVARCTVVGFSYGGLIGFKLAELHQDLVVSLIVSGSVMEMTESISSAAFENCGFSSWSDLLLPDTIEGQKLLISIGTNNKYFSQLPNFVYRDFLEVMYENRKERAELLKSMIVHDNDFRPAKYSQRIYLLWGGKDKIFDMESAYDTKGQLGDEATLECIVNSGHLVQLERPILYNNHLKKILASFHA